MTETVADAECYCVLFLVEIDIAVGIEHDHFHVCFWVTRTPLKNMPVNHAVIFLGGVGSDIEMEAGCSLPS